MMKMSHVTKKAPINGGINDLMINLWSDFKKND